MSSHQLLSLFHVAVVGPFFLYTSLNASSLPAYFYTFLMSLGFALALYQSYKAYTKYTMGSKDYIINLFHVAVVAPLLIYIGYRHPAASDFSYQLLLMLAFAVIGYHGYWLVRSLL
jgi:hypothetical protein